MTGRGRIAGFVALGTALLALGLWRDAWWTVVGGVGALAGAAWWATDAPTPGKQEDDGQDA